MRNLRALDPHGADADREHVAVDDDVISDQFGFELVEVAAPRPPELWVRHAQDTVRTTCRGDLVAAGVAEPHPDARRAGIGHRYRIADQPRPRLEVGHDGEVVDPGTWGRREPDAAVEPGVVEEVVILALPPGPVGQHLDHSRWDGLPRELVVDRDREPALLARRHEGGHVGFERGVATLVLQHTAVPEPHGGAVGGRVEPQHDPLSGPTAGDEDPTLIPDVADVIAQLAVHQDIVEAARHGHRSGVGERGAPPAFGSAHSGRVGREAPDAVEPLGLARDGVLWSQHAVSPCVG